jgi:hypothetical protein
MKELAHRVDRLIRDSFKSLSNRFPSWTSSDSQEWNAGFHRRDIWE